MCGLLGRSSCSGVADHVNGLLEFVERGSCESSERKRFEREQEAHRVGQRQVVASEDAGQHEAHLAQRIRSFLSRCQEWEAALRGAHRV